jgi:hypothetical protein
MIGIRSLVKSQNLFDNFMRMQILNHRLEYLKKSAALCLLAAMIPAFSQSAHDGGTRPSPSVPIDTEERKIFYQKMLKNLAQTLQNPPPGAPAPGNNFSQADIKSTIEVVGYVGDNMNRLSVEDMESLEQFYSTLSSSPNSYSGGVGSGVGVSEKPEGVTDILAVQRVSNELAKDERSRSTANLISTAGMAKIILSGVSIQTGKKVPENAGAEIKPAPNFQEQMDELKREASETNRNAQVSSSSQEASQLNRDGFLANANSLLANGQYSMNLANNPLFDPKLQPAISEKLQKMLMGPLLSEVSTEQSTAALGDLMKIPGFNNFAKQRIGRRRANDLNLASAGALILSDSKLPLLMRSTAAAQIKNGLSTQQMIASSPILASLNQAVGGNALGSLSEQTLSWIRMAGELAYGDGSTVPSKYRDKRSLYQAAFK